MCTLKAVDMLRSSTQLAKSHGDDLGLEYGMGMNTVLWKTVSKQSRKMPNIEDNKKSQP